MDLQLARVVRLARILVPDFDRAKSCAAPSAEKNSTSAQSTAMPFCSERCRTIDLGRWLGESYSLPAVPDPEADELPEADAADAQHERRAARRVAGATSVAFRRRRLLGITAAPAYNRHAAPTPAFCSLIPHGPMINQHDKLREVAWNELFRWLVLLRAVRIALLARVLVLGAMGLIATTLGWWAIDYVFSASTDPVVHECRMADDRERLALEHVARVFDRHLGPERRCVVPAGGQRAGRSAGEPVAVSHAAVHQHVSRRPDAGRVSVLCAVRRLGAVGVGPVRRGDHADRGTEVHARRSARSARRAEACGRANCRRTAWRRCSRWPGRPCLALQLVVLGWIMRLDLLALVAAFAWPFVLLLGLLMAILLIGALVGWPLMWATVSVEGTDAFDALSRSYAYTYQRPLRLLWYVLLAAILAAVSMFIVKLFATSAISLGNWSVSWGLDEETYREIVAPLPAATRRRVATAASSTDASAARTMAPLWPRPTSADELTGTRWLAAKAIRFWKSLLGALAAGYQAGFLWVAAVGVYLLLRKDIDGAEMDEVYVEDEPEFGMPPLADDHVTGVPEVQTDLASPESTTIG